MNKVFIGGSRRINRIEDPVRRRLDRIITQRIAVVIGDANGADRVVQRYLHERAYNRVQVFSSSERPRNNIGGWPIQVIRPRHAARDFDYYATKDRAMALEASVGLMIWDGESRGTLLNILRLIARSKTVVVYVAPDKAFANVRGPGDFEALTLMLDRTAARRLHEQAVSEGLADGSGAQPALRM